MPDQKFAAADILALCALAALAAFMLWRSGQSRGRTEYAAAAPVFILQGHAEITDGDSLKINGQRVRLVGIDAPELHQTCQKKDGGSSACGIIARDYLRGLIGGRHVQCRWAKRDKYQRILGHCFAQETDLNRAMARDGQAVSYSYAANSGNNYKREEREARQAKRGIWQGRFQPPKNWRKQHPRS